MNKLRVYEAAKGVTPSSGASGYSELNAAMEGFSVSRGAYATGNNFIYCQDPASGVYGIGARSKSGKSFVYNSEMSTKLLKYFDKDTKLFKIVINGVQWKLAPPSIGKSRQD
jgi:hypothetical protein